MKTTQCIHKRWWKRRVSHPNMIWFLKGTFGVELYQLVRVFDMSTELIGWRKKLFTKKCVNKFNFAVVFCSLMSFPGFVTYLLLRCWGFKARLATPAFRFSMTNMSDLLLFIIIKFSKILLMCKIWHTSRVDSFWSLFNIVSC